MKKQTSKLKLVSGLRRSILVCLVASLVMSFGCAQLRLPAIDPTGTGIFRPGSTQLLTPNSFQQNQFGLAAGQAGNPVFQPPAFTPPNNNLPANTGNQYP
ncbi:MAG: hypothetical protein ACI87E_004274, partial [Mariniblastus sp.]